MEQELSSNPSLGVKEAERAVKTVLGINEESDISLFEDYVAEADRERHVFNASYARGISLNRKQVL